MKTASTALTNTLRNQQTIKTNVRCLAEWEHNRFSVPTTSITPAQDLTTDPEWQTFFELSSIALPNRPTTGSAKARLGFGVVVAEPAYRDKPDDARFYPPSGTDVYKYFATTQRSGTTVGADNGYAFGQAITIMVTYPKPVIANKIVVGFETSYTKPKTWNIQYTMEGTTWHTAASNPVIQEDGTVSVWRNVGDGWTDQPDYTHGTYVKAVRINVYSLEHMYMHLDLLQLGARLESDVSDLVISYQRSFEVSDRSFVAPLGKASSNTGSITLSNIDGRFSNDTPNTLYTGMIDKRVKFTLDVGIDTTQQGGTGIEYVRELTMWADAWNAGDASQTTVQVDLKDSSVFLQEYTVPPVFFENATIGAVVWQLMDILGYTNYQYSRVEDENGQTIPFFWPVDSNNNVWQEFGSLAEVTQTAVFFDEYDVLQIKTRRSMYSANRPVDWNFDAVPAGAKLPDIISVQENQNMAANKVTATYKPAHFAEFNSGLPKMETVWQPTDDTVVLRSTALTRDLTTTGKDLWIRQADASTWPYTSRVNIQGEILEYTGKEYAYYEAGSQALRYKVVVTQDEKDGLDKISDQSLAWKNDFTGRLVVTKRGMMGTPNSNHLVVAANYTGFVTNYDNTLFHPSATIGQQMDGFMRLNSADPDVHTYSVLKSDTSVMGINSVTYGTKIRFPNDTDEQTAGLYFAGNFGDAGYYLEISPTRVIQAENTTWRHEFSLQAMPENAPHQPVRSDNGEGFKGFGWVFLANQWYTVDVKWTYTGPTTAYIVMFVDGIFAGDWFIGTHLNPDIAPPMNEGRFGIWVRGQTTCDFEYLYAAADGAGNSNIENSSGFLDLVNGGFTSGYIQRDWRYDWGFISPFYDSTNQYPQITNRAQSVFDEFGPQVHEIRQFDVKFDSDKTPVSSSYPYFTNQSQVACVGYESNSFGASILLANTSRDNAVIKGENALSPDNTATESLFVYGTCLYQDDEQTVIKTDDNNIRRIGTTATTIDSHYLQTSEAADSLASWIVDLWGGGCDEVTVVVFGNPLIQLGDKVTLNFPVKNMYPANRKYFVVSVDNEFESGLKTTLILRRMHVDTSATPIPNNNGTYPKTVGTYDLSVALNNTDANGSTATPATYPGQSVTVTPGLRYQLVVNGYINHGVPDNNGTNSYYTDGYVDVQVKWTGGQLPQVRLEDDTNYGNWNQVWTFTAAVPEITFSTTIVGSSYATAHGSVTVVCLGP